MSIDKEIIRKDVLLKATGETKFTDDILLKDFLWGIQIGSPVDKGILIEIIFSKNIPWSEYIICTNKDIPGDNLMSSVVNDLPILVEKEINYKGQPILLIAHKEKEKLDLAKKNISFDIDNLNPILNLKDSIEKKFLSYEKIMKKGDIDNGFSNSYYIYEDTYSTQAVDQAYIEPQSMIAYNSIKESKKIFVKGSMQCPFYIKKTLEKVFNTEEVEVEQIMTGGAFGGKEDYPSLIASHTALLSYKSGKNVKIIYDRNTDIKITTKRHPSIINIKVGIDKKKKFKALKMIISLDCGAYETLSRVVLARAMLHCGAYEFENVEIIGKLYKTNTPPNGAFRGFGAPQSFFAVESFINTISEKIKNIQKTNILKKNSIMNCSQKLKSTTIPLIFKEISNNYKEHKITISKFNRLNKYKKMGVGFSLFFHGAGFTGSGEVIMKSKAGLKLLKNGNIKILAASTELGQGVFTIFPQIVSKCLNIPYKYIEVEKLNTSKVPNSGPTVASRSTMVVGELLINAAEKLKKEIGTYKTYKEYKNKVLNYFKYNKIDEFCSIFKNPKDYSWDEHSFVGDAYSDYAWAGYLTIIEIDLISYNLKVNLVEFIGDIGHVINKKNAEGQVEGGILQGIGYSLFENYTYNTSGFSNYILPSIMEKPKMKIKFIENISPFGPFGAKGLGEIPLNGMAPAIANALYNAIGIRIKDLPITPEKILMELSINNEN